MREEIDEKIITVEVGRYEKNPCGRVWTKERGDVQEAGDENKSNRGGQIACAG